MSEKSCRAALLFCIDHRFNKHLDNFIISEGLDLAGADIIRLAGAVKNLVRPENEQERNLLLKQFRLARDLHGIEIVYLVNHEDCGAYGSEDVADSQEELVLHRNDLRAAREIVASALPGVGLQTVLIRLDGQAEAVA
jgi:hypothetical protein